MLKKFRIYLHEIKIIHFNVNVIPRRLIMGQHISFENNILCTFYNIYKLFYNTSTSNNNMHA